MKRIGFGLAVVLFLLSLACSGLMSATTVPPNKPAVKENTVEGKWQGWAPEKNELYLEVKGEKKTLAMTKGTKFYAAGGFGELQRRDVDQGLATTDVVVTLESKDGKDVATKVTVKPR